MLFDYGTKLEQYLMAHLFQKQYDLFEKDYDEKRCVLAVLPTIYESRWAEIHIFWKMHWKRNSGYHSPPAMQLPVLWLLGCEGAHVPFPCAGFEGI